MFCICKSSAKRLPVGVYIKGIEAYPDANIYIFDRFGRLLAKYKGIDRGWNGVYAGMPMSADDYWHIVILNNMRYPDIGHFTLKR